MIRLGTSGFSYDDWVGPVYPPGLPKREWLAYYAQRFDTVELNVTYYRIDNAHRIKFGLEARHVDNNYDTYGKLIRYEANIERGIYKALHELQRIQAARAGEKPPAPIVVDVDVSKE